VSRATDRRRPSRRSSLARQLRSLALVVFDFDGVLTDNRVLVTDDGREAAWCNRSDGLGLAALREINVPTLILSTEINPIVLHRARKLQTECIHGCADKWATLAGVLEAREIDPALVAYVGNDINDLECLRHVGLPICVADAYQPVKHVARIVTRRRGGEGAVREICDAIIRARGANS
jgi:3-deoxy-D-manno-octulosonate 8-phosphate phosphatase (KDO 8-P phosphatase)